jgi:hypothetical protein
MELPTYSIGNSYMAALMQGGTGGAPVRAYCVAEWAPPAEII